MITDASNKTLSSIVASLSSRKRIATIRDFRDRFSYYLRCARGADAFCPVTLKCRRRILGAGDGQWCIAESLLPPVPVTLSFGVGRDISFDTEMTFRYRSKVYLFDPTPISKSWIAKQVLPEGMSFYPLGLADRDGDMTFELPVTHGVSYSMHHKVLTSHSVVCPVRKFSTILNELKCEKVDVVKIDIEGAEYIALPDLLSSEAGISQLLIEFHQRLEGSTGLEMTKSAIKSILDAGFECFYRSPRAFEYCFARVQ